MTDTPGRLTPEQRYSSIAIVGDRAPETYVMHRHGSIKDPRAIEFARRLAAAWNATLGVPLDVLERIDMGRLVEAARKLAVESLGVAELARDSDIGNTNANVLIRKAEAVRAALGETDQ